MEWVEGDPLDLHIRQKGLGLGRRRPTVTDGNCWYDAVADQVILIPKLSPTTLTRLS